MNARPTERQIKAALDAKTKPPGSLGRLEQLAQRMASIQGTLTPTVERPRVVLFAADHGVSASASAVSAYPREVTAQMLANFAHGGAAVCVLAASAQAELELVDVGVDADTHHLPRVLQDKVSRGSHHLGERAALDRAELEHALAAGARAFARAQAASCDLLVLGEMGIGNTTSASALLSALLGLSPALTTGAGTGVSGKALARKRQIIRTALARNAGKRLSPEQILSEYGGLEIAALVGALLASYRARIPVLIDGFIVTVAALLAVKIEPELSHALIYAHRSDERGHRHALAALGAEPLLDWQMRLGEGSGATLAIPLCRAAARILCEMATFESAAVSGG